MYEHNYNTNKLYSIFKTDNATALNILEAYSEGHSRLWKMFFGWRETDKHNVSTYYVPHKDFETIRLLIEEVI